METKLLDFNLDKSYVIVMGSKKNKIEIDKQMEINPLTLCGQKMKVLKKEKYLGDIICSEGLAASVQATVMKRKGDSGHKIFHRWHPFSGLQHIRDMLGKNTYGRQAAPASSC